MVEFEPEQSASVYPVLGQALYEAANVLLTRAGRFSTLKRWALGVAQRRGMRRAKVALARKLATVLHRLWADGSEFRFGKEAAAA